MMAIRCKEYRLPLAGVLEVFESPEPKTQVAGLEGKAIGITFPDRPIIR